MLSTHTHKFWIPVLRPRCLFGQTDGELTACCVERMLVCMGEEPKHMVKFNSLAILMSEELLLAALYCVSFGDRNPKDPFPSNALKM